jgi:lipid-A-disaccharide synthase-like uncharacterized protein
MPMTVTAENVWTAVGFAGQVVFGSRFLVQWIATERRKKSVVPTAFWYLSLVGTVILLTYSIYRLDAVFIAGFSLNMLVYLRNLYFIHRSVPEPVEVRSSSGGSDD